MCLYGYMASAFFQCCDYAFSPTSARDTTANNCELLVSSYVFLLLLMLENVYLASTAMSIAEACLTGTQLL